MLVADGGVCAHRQAGEKTRPQAIRHYMERKVATFGWIQRDFAFRDQQRIL